MTDHLETESTQTNATRRTVLRTAGLVALAGGGAAAFVGCSSDGDAATPAAPSSSAQAAAGATVTKTDVPEGGGVVLQEKYVVTQPKAGEFKAFTATCTHQGCAVNKIEAEQIVCPCHGSKFSITDGSVVGGPAQKPLPAVNFTESGDNIVISG
jgi:Rieske Fe-S protein